MSGRKTAFLGTYFDRDAVLRWSRVIAILAWVVAGIYALDLVLSLGTMGLQYCGASWLAWDSRTCCSRYFSWSSGCCTESCTSGSCRPSRRVC